MWIVWICETVAYSEGWAGCWLYGLLSLKKSPNIQESNMWIVWICETVAYYEGGGGWDVETNLNQLGSATAAP